MGEANGVKCGQRKHIRSGHGVAVPRERVGRTRPGSTVTPCHGEYVGPAGGSGEVEAVARTDSVHAQVELGGRGQKFKRNLHSRHIAVGRIIGCGMDVGRKNRQVVGSATARTDCLVDHAVGVEARGSAVDVLVGPVAPKVAGVLGVAAAI